MQADRSQTEDLPRRGNPRLRGVAYLLVGLGLAKLQVYDPLHARQMGMSSVLIHSTLFSLGLILPVFGLAYIFFGKAVDQFMDTLGFNKTNVYRTEINRRNLLYLMVTCVPIIVLLFWVMGALTAQGYRVALL
jgi:MFS family permease